MSEYFFGLGRGWLPKRAEAIARKHGAALCNHVDPQCSCGYGCAPFTCKAARRHWFACPNHGKPFNSDTGRTVLEALKKAGVSSE